MSGSPNIAQIEILDSIFLFYKLFIARLTAKTCVCVAEDQLRSAQLIARSDSVQLQRTLSQLSELLLDLIPHSEP